MHAHAITINICFWANRTAATDTVIITTITSHTKRAIEQGMAITWVTCVGSLSGMGTISKKGG